MFHRIQDIISIIKVKLFFLRLSFYAKLIDIFGTIDLRNSHLGIRWEDWGLKFTVHSHEQYLKAKRKELRDLKRRLKSEDFVREAVIASQKCQFIIFSGKDEGNFIQFWLADRSIYCGWPLVEKNNLSKHKLAMLGVLNELDITQQPRRLSDWPFPPVVYYQLTNNGTFDEYVIYFARDYELIGVFANQVITEVFGEEIKNLKVILG